jgi:hypothetical protein
VNRIAAYGQSVFHALARHGSDRSRPISKLRHTEAVPAVKSSAAAIAEIGVADAIEIVESCIS